MRSRSAKDARNFLANNCYTLDYVIDVLSDRVDTWNQWLQFEITFADTLVLDVAQKMTLSTAFLE